MTLAEPRHYGRDEVPAGTPRITCPHCAFPPDPVPHLPGALEWHWLNRCSGVSALRFNDAGVLVAVEFHRP